MAGCSLWRLQGRILLASPSLQGLQAPFGLWPRPAVSASVFTWPLHLCASASVSTFSFLIGAPVIVNGGPP